MRGVLVLTVFALGAAAGLVTGRASSAQPVERLPVDVYPDSRSRLPLVKREALDEFGTRLFDEIAKDSRRVTGFQGPGGLRLHSPRSGAMVRDLNSYLRFESPLGARTVELAILVAARELDSQFEWAAHEGAARRAGVPDEIIELVRHRRSTGNVDERDRAVIELGREAVGGARRVTSSTFARAHKVFGSQSLLDLAVLLGEYASTSILLNIVDQQLPAGQAPPLPTLK